MKLLIKIGGTLLDSPDLRGSLARQLAHTSQQGHECVVVHGGGRQLTRFLDERGVPSQFVNGLRVTSPETIDAVLKVLAGSVNQELVAALVRVGVLPVGLSGVDANLVQAEQLDPALGAVGRVTHANPELLHLLIRNGYLPVVACVAGDGEGGFYNINGDSMAVACAVAFQADQIIFLTDVPGVLDASGRLLPVLTVADTAELIAQGVAKGGMQAKLNAATLALAQGVGRVRIIPGAADRPLERALAGESLGTQVVQEVGAPV